MNDNKKSVLQQALDAVRGACSNDEISDAEFQRLIGEFRCKLTEQGKLTSDKKQSH